MTFKPAERLRNVKKSITRRLYDAALPGSINFGLGEPDFQTPEVIRREACRVINNENNGYTMNAGLRQLREKIAQYHNEDIPGRYSPDSICVTVGVEEGLFATVMSIANPGDEVLMPDPAFVAYPAIVEIAGAITTRYSLPASGRFAFDPEAFDRAVTAKTRLVFVSSPSNPTGRVLSRSDLKHIAGRLVGTGACVVSDEIYRELYFKERPASIAEYYANTIVLSGLSKMSSMTGWRLGWLAGPEEVVSYVTVMHQYATSCASTISQKAAIAAFSEEGRKATADFRHELRRRGELMAAAIEREIKLPYVLGEGAYYIMLDVSQFGGSEWVAMELLKNRVITAPGGAFGSKAEGFLRLSFSIEPAQIEEGIQRLAGGLRRL
ncbi:MAG TPA: pyridoxal phosphate-dependent aminotransferase [Blastocatellia bacterium]|nr:pyridoxal phosphate-dependent aminotransferase [Blastocatellia bacterium]